MKLAEQDTVIISRYYVIVAMGEPCKNTLYFVFSCLYLKNELGHPHFLFQKSNQKGMMKFPAKLSSGFRATLILWFF